MRVLVGRGDLIESEHRVVAVGVDPDGGVIWASGPDAADRPTIMRSAAKPFQAAAAVERDVLDRLDLSDRHLAAACSSHNAGPEHLSLVDEILTAAGLDRTALQCGDDGQGGAFRHQCSGNHAFGLAWCVTEGWPLDGYLDAEHPLQRAYRATVETVAGTAPDEVADGCGMRSFVLPLHGYARAFARLGTGWAGSKALARVAAAMRAHPRIVRWPGEPDTELMLASDRFVAKVGAEGSIGVGHASGVGVAVKVLDGAMRALGPAVVDALSRIEATSADALSVDRSVCEPAVRDGQGRRVGSISSG